MGAIFMAMVGMQAQAAPLGDGLGEGIASNFDQTTDLSLIHISRLSKFRR